MKRGRDRRDREMLRRWSEGQTASLGLSPAEKAHATRLAKMATKYERFYVIPFADDSAAIGGFSKEGPAHLLVKRVRSVAIAEAILRRVADSAPSNARSSARPIARPSARSAR